MSLPRPDALLHQPIRTQNAVLLWARGEATFSDLKQGLQATDGNLDAHLNKFITAGWIDTRRRQEIEHRAQTVYCLSDAGRAALEGYIAQLQKLVELPDQHSGQGMRHA